MFFHLKDEQMPVNHLFVYSVVMQADKQFLYTFYFNIIKNEINKWKLFLFITN